MTEGDAATAPTCSTDTVRVGVTGHRAIDDPRRVAAEVARALARIKELSRPGRSTDVCIEVVSPLAEGADRLVVREALKDPQARLVVPLPLPRDEYVKDFEGPTSRAEFDELLARAARVEVLPPAVSREASYEQVGSWVVDHCDVLLALWDGEPTQGPGGTADIVALAVDMGLLVLWVQTAREGGLRELRKEG